MRTSKDYEDIEGLPGSAHSVPALILSPYPSGHPVAAHDLRKRDPVWAHVLQFGGYLCHLTVGEKTQTERQFSSHRSLAPASSTICVKGRRRELERRSSLGNSNQCANFCGAESRVVVHCDSPVVVDLIQYGAAWFSIPEGPTCLDQLKRPRGDDKVYCGKSGRSDIKIHLERMLLRHPCFLLFPTFFGSCSGIFLCFH